MIAPVDELIERPLGRAGETVNVTGDDPPDDVTGVELAATIPAVKTGSYAIATFFIVGSIVAGIFGDATPKK